MTLDKKVSSYEVNFWSSWRHQHVALFDKMWGAWFDCNEKHAQFLSENFLSQIQFSPLHKALEWSGVNSHPDELLDLCDILRSYTSQGLSVWASYLSDVWSALNHTSHIKYMCPTKRLLTKHFLNLCHNFYCNLFTICTKSDANSLILFYTHLGNCQMMSAWCKTNKCHYSKPTSAPFGMLIHTTC